MGRDVLLVDTAPERNSRNHPYSGMHPRAVDGFPSASLAVEWLTRFTDWLTTWTESVLPTVDFRVIEEAQAEEAPPIEEVAATSVEGAPVEEAPLVEEVAATSVEEATRVEEAPGQETTPVEDIPVAIPIPAAARSDPGVAVVDFRRMICLAFWLSFIYRTRDMNVQ
ncbi:hypothetical protein R1sor_022917 [Riccia sorocarpa]|uniref:Uncharacterized protein n=1 Tax=Riccia sorocarpa TaxID=122646 RepID=A0ABD3GQ48_9MARC